MITSDEPVDAGETAIAVEIGNGGRKQVSSDASYEEVGHSSVGALVVFVVR